MAHRRLIGYSDLWAFSVGGGWGLGVGGLPGGKSFERGEIAVLLADWSARRDRFDSQGHLEAGIRQILVLDLTALHQFGKGAKLVSLPIRVVEILIEDEDGARHDALLEM